MLNYLWSGMILVSIAFALASDVSDELNDTFANQKPYIFNYQLSSKSEQASFVPGSDPVFFTLGEDNQQLTIEVDKALPQIWQHIAAYQSGKEKDQLKLTVREINEVKQQLTVLLPEVHWVKLRAITTAAFDMAEFAVKLALGLAGIMALWLGLMRIAEKSGLIQHFVKLIYPLLHWLFPKIDKNHPVLGSISLNMTANILGLGNAATPMGIKAMQQLQQLNHHKDRASDEMCMFLAINTSSVQLLPPVTLIAIMGVGVSELLLPIILATSASTIAAIISAKTFARMRAR